MKALNLTNQKMWPMRDKQTDTRTNGRAKIYMPPDLSMRGHNKFLSPCDQWTVFFEGSVGSAPPRWLSGERVRLMVVVSSRPG